MARNEDTMEPTTDGALDDRIASMDASSIDVIELVMADHRRVEELFEQIERADADEREPLVEELVLSLRIHMEIEEDLLYPLVESEVDEDVAEEAEAEHQLARHGVEELLALAPDEPGFDGALAMLKAGILHHVGEEEQQALPRLRDELPDTERMELGRQVAEAMTELRSSGGAGNGTKAARKAPRSNGTSKKSRSGKNASAKRSAPDESTKDEPTKDEPTKDELLAEAREQGIAGTSKMNKADLLDVLGKR